VMQLMHVKSIGYKDDMIEEASSNGDALDSKTISSNDDNDDKKIKSVFKNQLKSTEQIKENLVKSPELKSKPLQNSTIKTFQDLVRTANEEKEVELKYDLERNKSS